MVSVDGALRITGSGQISADTYSRGKGGNLTIYAESLLVNGSATPHLFTGISADAADGIGNGGDLTITVSGLLNVVGTGSITADTYSTGKGGNLTIQARSVSIDGSGSDFFTGISTDSNAGATGRAGDLVVQAGDLKLVDDGQISSSTYGSGVGGIVNVTANSLLIDGANSPLFTGISASAQHGSSGNAGSVIVEAGNLKIVGTGEIRSVTLGRGDGGSVDVTANSLLIDGGMNSAFTTGISANAEAGSRGDAGSVTVHAGNLELIDYGDIQSVTFAYGSGGNVDVTANSLLINGGGNLAVTTGISASADHGSKGNAGNVTVHAGDLELIDYGDIQSVTFAQGDGGNVDVTTNSLLINADGNSAVTTGITASADHGSRGNAGNITVHAGDLELIDYGEIQSVTFAHGDGGNVDVTANSLLINAYGNSAVTTGITTSAEYGSTGNGGSVAVQADHLTITDRGSIASSTFGFGHGGNVSVKADSLSIDGLHSGIFAAANVGSIGRSGDVVVDANSVSLQSSAEISAASFTAAAAGSVQLSVGALTVDSGSSISSANTGSGKAGNVVIQTRGPVTVKHGSSISTASEMSDAGFIKILSEDDIKLKDRSSITVSAGHNGGDILITTPDLVYLLNSSITATAGANGVTGTGGNITIDGPQFIVLQNSFISANAAIGQGGNIRLVSDFLFNSDLSNSNITATGTTNGTVNITAPALDLGAELITLPTSLLSAESQLQERCTALLRGDFSSFISIGRGGTEPAPEELQITF
jgi:large exoprotein involved in heme utilization and adhesion